MRVSLWLLFCLTAAVSAENEPDRLSGIERRFIAREEPVMMEYEVGYRFFSIEWMNIGRVLVETTIGEWPHAGRGTHVPAVMMNVRVDSPDSGKPGERRRVSIHDHLIAILTVPDLEALLFARCADQHLNPLIGRLRTVSQFSLYDLQSGSVAFYQTNLLTGECATNLLDPAGLLELSRQVGPLMRSFVEQCPSYASASLTSDAARISVNMDGRVVPILLKTRTGRSPAFLERERRDVLQLSTAPEPGSAFKPRDFTAWTLRFKALAQDRNDASLQSAAGRAPMESIVPLVFDYELALGSVRATMTSIRTGRPDQDAGG